VADTLKQIIHTPWNPASNMSVQVTARAVPFLLLFSKMIIQLTFFLPSEFLYPSEPWTLFHFYLKAARPPLKRSAPQAQRSSKLSKNVI
jgi:hypothetical protein